MNPMNNAGCLRPWLAWMIVILIGLTVPSMAIFFFHRDRAAAHSRDLELAAASIELENARANLCRAYRERLASDAVLTPNERKNMHAACEAK